MGKPFMKGLAVTAVGIAAVAVCFVGYKADGQRQYEQRVQYANKAIDKGEKELTALEETIGMFYQGDKQVLLRSDLKDSDISAVRTKLEAVKTDPESYQIQSADLKENTEAIGKKKEQLESQLKIAQNKLLITNDTNALFEKKVSSWSEAVNDVVIKKDLKDEDIGNIREDLKLSKIDDNWSKVVKEYLDYASAQVKRVKEIKASLKEMLKDGEITEKATYDAYITLSNSISQVRNKELKADFTEDLTTIGNQIGSYSSYSDEYSDTDYSDSQSDSDSEGYSEDYSDEDSSDENTGDYSEDYTEENY